MQYFLCVIFDRLSAEKLRESLIHACHVADIKLNIYRCGHCVLGGRHSLTAPRQGTSLAWRGAVAESAFQHCLNAK